MIVKNRLKIRIGVLPVQLPVISRSPVYRQVLAVAL